MGVSDGSEITVSEQAPAEPQRDAGAIDAEQFKRCPLPQRITGRHAGYQLVIRRSVLNDIRAHALSNPDVEVCGVLVGAVWSDMFGAWGFVSANIRGNYSSGRNAQVTFTSETWTDIHRQMEEKFAKQRILGWYHSHPGFGIFLSEMDVFIQEHFFAASWQVAFVDDPKRGDRGLFVWRGGKPVREEYLIEEDVAAPDEVAGVAGTPRDVHPAHEHDVISAPRHKPVPVAAVVACGAGVVVALAAFVVWWFR